MIRSSTLLVFVCASASAGASGFQLAPQIVAVANGNHTQELTLSLLPSANTVGAQLDVTIDLDRFGWVQVIPAAPTSGASKECIVIDGKVRGTIVSATTFPTMYSIPVCRIRVRPHLVTPRGNYYTSYANGTSLKLDGSTTAAYANSVRIIVD